MIAFRRSTGSDELLSSPASTTTPFDDYVIQTEAWRLPDGAWREIFNSDAAIYGGTNVGNFGADVLAAGGRVQLRVPATGLVVFEKV